MDCLKKSSKLLDEINKEFRFKLKTIEELQKFFFMLNHWNQKMNLVGHKNSKEIILKSGIDCLLVADYFLQNKLFMNKNGLDFGSGAGLPGVILKIVQHHEKAGNLRLYLIDSKQKKTTFLKQVNLELKLNLQICFSRIQQSEEIKKNKFDWIISRATLNSNQKLIQILKGFLKTKGEIYLMKSEPIKKIANIKRLENIKLKYKKNNLTRYLIKIIP